MSEHEVQNIEKALERNAALYIDHLVAGRGHRSTYGDLLVDVRTAKARLKELGVRAGMRVGILAENEYSWVVADIALISSGCISVAFPVGYFRSADWAELPARFGIQLLLIEDAFESQTQSHWVVPLRALREEVSTEQTWQALSMLQIRECIEPDVFALAFSSGTSGKLKCLKISYSGVNAFLSECMKNIDLTPDDLLLIFVSLSGFSQRELVYAAILYGFNLALVRPPEVFRGLATFEPTLLAAPPVIYDAIENRLKKLKKAGQGVPTALAAEPADNDQNMRELHTRLGLGSRLRLALTCAAPSRLNTLKAFEELRIPLLQCYGLTETGYLTCNWPKAHRVGTVGRELFPGSLHVAEDGELFYFSSNPVALGYYNCEAEEQKKTFCAKDRIATGDLVSVDADGYYRIIGRKKNIIVTQGGVKVQPEELEAKLRTHWAVKSAAVLGGESLPAIQAVVSLGDDDSSAVRREVDDLIRRMNGERPPECGIMRAVYTSEPFTIENGLLNRAEKINRAGVLERFRASLVTEVGGD